MAQQDVVGVLLGAGSSRRLGRPKQTLPLGDTTVLGWTLRDAEQSALERVCVVLGGAADEARDPVCGMVVDVARVRLRSEHDGRTYFFCSAGCRREFDADPVKYAVD